MSERCLVRFTFGGWRGFPLFSVLKEANGLTFTSKPTIFVVFWHMPLYYSKMIFHEKLVKKMYLGSSLRSQNMNF